MDGEQVRSVTWEAFDRLPGQRSGDWFWLVGIATITGCVVSILLGNLLFALLVLVAGGVVALLGTRESQPLPYAVTTRGVRVDEKIFPYNTLESFFILEEDEEQPILLVKSKRLLMPLMVIPLPEEYLDEIEELIASRLPEEPMEEPVLQKVLEFFGF